MIDPRLQETLKYQISFLETSNSAFDSGNYGEAARLATTIRVLIHDTNNSTSLLQQLGEKSKVNLLSTAIANFDPNNPKQFLTCTIAGFDMRLNDKGIVSVKQRPHLNDATRLRQLPVSIWWEEEIFGMPGTDRFTRKDFVLFLANKDGGAHVDEIPEKFKKLKNGGIGLEFVLKDGTKFLFARTIECAVRQMSYEILMSVDVQKLVS